ncbi:MAG TPA: D-2-hydroxyacid dehydrogenase [Hyphomicrobiaceae bacterium]|nr:D-2-hydroxyacid dehydrogenase [Hyphomicrobiaceae bacterium]
MLPGKDKLTICFAHPAYQMASRFAARGTGIAHFQVRNPEDYATRLPDADVVVSSMLWKNDLVSRAKRLKFVQSISAGIDQYDKEVFRAHGIRLASAAGVNAHAVAEHAIALILALQRHLHTGRDNQAAKRWRGMISDIPAREDELGGKRLLIVGLGRIGRRLTKLAKAFDLEVVATRRDPSRGREGTDAVHGHDRLHELLPTADIVALTCPLTSETTNLIDAKALGRMKPTAHLVNVARGRVVDEDALLRALAENRIAAAGLDVTREEPLPATSPLWAMPNVLITPHTAGETQRYEDGVIDLLLENLNRLWRGEASLINEVV